MAALMKAPLFFAFCSSAPEPRCPPDSRKTQRNQHKLVEDRNTDVVSTLRAPATIVGRAVWRASSSRFALNAIESWEAGPVAFNLARTSFTARPF